MQEIRVCCGPSVRLGWDISPPGKVSMVWKGEIAIIEAVTIDRSISQSEGCHDPPYPSSMPAPSAVRVSRTGWDPPGLAYGHLEWEWERSEALGGVEESSNRGALGLAGQPEVEPPPPVCVFHSESLHAIRRPES